MPRWDSAALSRAGPGPEGLAPAGSSRVLGATHDSASGSGFGDTQGGDVGIERTDSAAASGFGGSRGIVGADSASGSVFADAQDGGSSDGGVGEEKGRG